MALFCDPDDLGDALGAHSFTSDDLAAFCSRASSRVMQGLKIYWEFPDYNATVPTPEAVREAALEYALFLALQKQGIDNQVEEQGEAVAHRANCDKLLDDMNDTARTELTSRVTGEVLAFGALDGDYVSGYADAHVLAWQDVEIRENSAAIDGFFRAPDNFRLSNPGGHFGIRYDDASGKWLLWRFDQRIVDAMTVSYTIDWRKWTKAAEDEAAPVSTSATVGRIVLG